MGSVREGSGQVKNRFLITTIIFGAYIFVFMSSNTLQNQLFSPLGDNDAQLRMYYIQQSCMLLGFLAYALWSARIRLFSNLIFRCFLAVLYLFCMLLLLFVRTPEIFYVFLPVSVLITGFTGGSAYEYLAFSFLGDNARFAKLSQTIGIGGAAAIVLQWLLQFVLSLQLILVLIVTAMIFLIFFLQGDSSGKEIKEEPVTGKSGRIRDVIILCLIVAAVMITLALYEVHINHLEFATYFFEWPRLCIMIGYLVIALAGSFGRKDAPSIAMMCMALFTVLFPIVMQDMGQFYLHMSIYYSVLGTAVAWFSLMFVYIAPYYPHSAFVAATGRYIDILLTVFLGLLNITNILTQFQAALIDILLLALAIVLMRVLLGGALMGISDADQNAFGTDKSLVSTADPVAAFAEKYSFTPRETEVYRLLVTTDLKNQEIADQLYISRRALQNHIKSIYEKSETSNRAGLIMAVRSDNPE